MELRELQKNQNVVVQIIWGDREIEFSTKVLEANKEGVMVKPYLHEEHPLEMQIAENSGINVNLFADHPDTKTRMSWRNIKLTTVEYENEMAYHITTAGFNRYAQSDERREHERLIVRQKGEVVNGIGETPREILIHDMSDNGLSFYAPTSFVPTSSRIYVSFNDFIKADPFYLKVECHIVYFKKKAGTVFYGCEITNVNRDYLLYGCLRRLRKNIKEESEEKEKVEDVSAKLAEEVLTAKKQDTETSDK